jgi:hypothetical protein
MEATHVNCLWGWAANLLPWDERERSEKQERRKRWRSEKKERRKRWRRERERRKSLEERQKKKDEARNKIGANWIFCIRKVKVGV